MRLTTVIFLLALITPASAALPQPPASTTQTLRGIVVTSSDVPLARVRVAVGGASQLEPPVLTDERGRFAVRVPVAELVQLMFTKARYATALVDVRRSELSASAETQLRVRLSLGGAISGQVRDRSGEAVMQVAVTAWRLGSAPPSVPPVQSVTTNDLGEFRFAGLVPGAYALGMRPPTQVDPAAAAQDVPAQQTVNVGLGAEVSGVDFTIDLPSGLSSSSSDRTPVQQGATASIRGRVTTARGAPIGGAAVQAYGSSGAAAAVTDARGRFVITGLAAGEYRVLASKRGFIAPSQGRSQSAAESLLQDRSSQDRTITALRGQTTESIDLILGRGASITGTIADEFGEPLSDVVVSALELRMMGGRMRALRASSSQGNFGRTDDRGRYRLYGLQPGTYVVQAVANDLLSASNGYVPQFYPGTPSIDVATPTRLGIDEAATGIDLTLLPGPTRRVRGTVLDPGGVPAVGVMLALMVSERTGILTEPVRTSTNGDGIFAFENVPPGDYIVQATVNSRAVPDAKVAISRQFATASITVAGDEPLPLQLKLSFGATLMGHVVYEGIPEVTAPYSAIKLSTIPALVDRDPLVAADSSSFALLSDNTFEYRGAFGSSFISVRPRDAKWYVKSITYKGQELADSLFDFDVTDTFRDIEIVVSGASATVEGRVTDERAAPVRGYSVAVFSTDRSKWTISSRWLRTVRATLDGTFRLSGLVPGDYWVVAVDRLDGSEVAGDLQNPDVLDALAARAQRISLGEGQSQNLTLRLVRR